MKLPKWVEEMLRRKVAREEAEGARVMGAVPCRASGALNPDDGLHTFFAGKGVPCPACRAAL